MLHTLSLKGVSGAILEYRVQDELYGQPDPKAENDSKEGKHLYFEEYENRDALFIRSQILGNTATHDRDLSRLSQNDQVEKEQWHLKDCPSVVLGFSNLHATVLLFSRFK